MRYSLRNRLLLILVGLVLSVWLASVIFTALHARTVVSRQIDEQLIRYADMAEHTLSSVLASPEIRRHFADRAYRSADSGKGFTTSFTGDSKRQAVNLWFTESQVLVGEGAPSFPRRDQEGLETVQISQNNTTQNWRVEYRHVEKMDVWLAVGLNLASSRQVIITTFWEMMAPLLIVLPLTAGILIFGVNRGLKPLGILAASIAARSPQALHPITPQAVPRELDPVIDALNELLKRLERALVSETRFTANAAHELQTPLAAIKAEVQRSQRQVQDLTTREMLARIETRVTRATETVRQLLTLARLDPDQEFDRARVDLGALTLEVIAELGALAVDRQLEIELDLTSNVRLYGHAEWIQIMLRNIVTNAFKYASAPGSVKISLVRGDNEALLTVTNDCEPLPADSFRRLTERFYRPSEQGGVGLGLAIANRIAELHNARLEVYPKINGRGFTAQIQWPDIV